jgi:hypothetical protein
VLAPRGLISQTLLERLGRLGGGAGR